MMNTREEQEKIYYYSLNADITPKQLKEQSSIENDPERKEKLIKRMEKYNLQGITEFSEDYPVKFKLIP
ncbi:hypothetical protein IJM86_07345 [bacterium]|nr:hypothetical protein [bacterium]